MSDESFESGVATVTGLARTSQSANDGHTVIYQVTAVDKDGNEGFPDLVQLTGNAAMDGSKASAWTTIKWNAQTDAVFYKIYRSRSVDSTTTNSTDSTVGYIGRAVGKRFTDNGIVPDFSDQPPKESNPFADGRIEYVQLTTAGATYSYGDTITWPSGGSGAYGYLICDPTGSSPVDGVLLISGGSGYTGTSVTSSGGDGNFAGTAVLSDASGNNPHCAALFQQRCVYAATDNYPLRLFGSQPGLFSNMNITQLGAPDDAYQFDIDADTIAPIRHILAVRGGLLVFTQAGVWLLSDGQGRLANRAGLS